MTSHAEQHAEMIALPGAEDLAAVLGRTLACPHRMLRCRRFPDGETWLRIDPPPSPNVALVARLDDPDRRIPALLFAAELLRELGATRLGLVCPYLPYMRQDARFHPGEAVTSKMFAGWISARFDWLVTVDPHLHRYHSLEQIYALDAHAVSAAAALANWISAEVDDPLIVGPDAESEQWVRAVAEPAGLAWHVLSKTRNGDRDVVIGGELPDGLAGHTPVLVDDIVSSGATLAEAADLLVRHGARAPVCVAVHGLFAPGALDCLRRAGVERVACTDSVPSDPARIALAPSLAPVVRRCLETPA